MLEGGGSTRLNKVLYVKSRPGNCQQVSTFYLMRSSGCRLFFSVQHLLFYLLRNGNSRKLDKWIERLPSFPAVTMSPTKNKIEKANFTQKDRVMICHILFRLLLQRYTRGTSLGCFFPPFSGENAQSIVIRLMK